MKARRHTLLAFCSVPLIALLIGLSSCQLFLGGSTTVPVTSLALNKTTLLLELGGTETLVATVAPADATNKNIGWSSSAPAIASVSQAGLVTALTVGSATVTATSKDGGFFKDCLVTVSPKTVIPAITTSAPFWGHWVRMDQEEFWYIADTSVTQGSTDLAVSAASDSSVTAGSHTLVKQTDNVLKVDNGAFYLYRSKGAQGTISGAVSVQGASRALGGLSGVSLVIANIKNALNAKTVEVKADGTFATDTIVPTDSYQISSTITKSDGTKAAGPSITVTPQSMAEDIGTIQLVSVAYNFKVSVSTSAGFLYADGSAIPITIKVKNIGTADSKGASYEFPAQTGVTVSSSVDSILGTIKPGAEKAIASTVSCASVTGEYEDKPVKIAISDAYGNVWNDQVSLRFYKKEMSYSVASINNPVFGVVMTPEKEGYWFTTVAASGNLYSSTIKVPWRERGCLLALSRATVATESRYSVGVDTAAGSEAQMIALKKTSAFEPNDLETQAAGIALGEMIVAYLHDEDIDFYAVGGKVAAPLASPVAGTFDNAVTVSLASPTSGAAIHYMLDATTPTSASTLYVAGTPIAISQPITIKAIASAAGLGDSNILEAAFAFKVATPLFTSANGSWTIATASKDATIRYTTDSSDPTSVSTIYDGTAIAAGASVIKAKAYKAGWTDSELGASSAAPTASFTISPASPKKGGTVTFDASASTDDDTTTATLQASWNYGDSSAATAYSTTKTSTHSYTDAGSYNVTLSVKDQYGVIGTKATAITVSTSAAPVVSITASPGSVNNSGSFAAVASDDDSTEAEIQVRWDWENDGTWDSDWSATKTATHAYTSVGDKTLAVAAKDKFGVTASVTKTITIVSYFLSGFAMLPVTGGSFTSGSSTVTVSGFTMSATEITQAQYKAVTGDSPSYFSTVTGGPVEDVTWYDAVEFCNLLSAKEGKASAYTITARSPATGYPITSATVSMDKTKNGYRLPTEAEWEFAARGGTKTKSYSYSGSNDVGTVAWYSSNASSTTHPVGTKTANELGLFDMSGNVWEWCWDWYGGSLSGTDPTGPSTGSSRVVRGGSWNGDAGYCTVSNRLISDPTYGDYNIGFRVLAP